jgi:amino acid permease
VSGDAPLFSREALTQGLPARRATALLFAIENRTAHLVAGSRAVPIVLSESAARQREQDFLEAVAQGRDLPVRPTIQDLERHAPAWADLVPGDPAMRAGLAHLIGTKYAAPYPAVPQLRAALGLDTDAVAEAYRRLYGTSPQATFGERLSVAARLRWAASRVAGRLDALPAFWLAFVVTLIIGAVNLALPIAVAGVGALPGVLFIVVLGLVNLVTITAMVEVVARSGRMRFGDAFIGTVVGDYLGSAASAILSAVLIAFSFGILLVFYVGIATTLADATTLPAAGWMLLLFAVGLYFLTRGSLNATVASSIVITSVNVGLLVVLSGLALAHFQLENVTYMNLPWVGGSFDPLVLGALVGVVLDVFGAHMLVTIFGKTLLQRDPGGRSVVRGHAAGIGFAMLLNVVWVVAVSGAIAPQVLAAEPSTVLVPLAAVAGPLVAPLGAIFVILSMGLGLVHFSLALFNLARERIGARHLWGGSRSRFFLALSPVIAVLLVAEWMVLTDSGSFTGILGFLGVIVHSLMAGVFPVLLLVASRRKGEIVPGVSYRVLGHPLVVAGVYMLFLSNLFVHGVLIWDQPIQQLGAVLIGVAVLGMTAAMLRRGAFATRAVIELRADRRPEAPWLLSLTSGGAPATAEVHRRDASGDWRRGELGELSDVGSLRGLRIDLPAGLAPELRVWAHAITAEGTDEALPTRVTVRGGGATQDLEPDATGMVTLRPGAGPGEVEISLGASPVQGQAG